MIEKEDWRLLNDVEQLKQKDLNPTDGEELYIYTPYLKKCVFCWEPVQDNCHQWWYIPMDKSCCICEQCYNDFKDIFKWKKLDGWDIWNIK